MYSSRMQEKQHELLLCEEEVHKAVNTNSYLSEIISELRTDLKKYVYEVDILTEDNHQQTLQFISHIQK